VNTFIQAFGLHVGHSADVVVENLDVSDVDELLLETVPKMTLISERYKLPLTAAKCISRQY